MRIVIAKPARRCLRGGDSHGSEPVRAGGEDQARQRKWNTLRTHRDGDDSSQAEALAKRISGRMYQGRDLRAWVPLMDW